MLTDWLEDILILALEAKQEELVEIEPINKLGYRLEDSGWLLDFEPMYPKSAYTIAFGNDSSQDRLYTKNTDLLAVPAFESFQNQAEILILTESEGLKWYGFKRVHKAPHGAAALGKAAIWYELHGR